MRFRSLKSKSIAAALASAAIACGSGFGTPTSATTTSGGSTNTSLPAGYSQFTNGTSVTLSGSTVIVSGLLGAMNCKTGGRAPGSL